MKSESYTAHLKSQNNQPVVRADPYYDDMHADKWQCVFSSV